MPDDVDAAIGRRLRARRIELGLTMTQVGSAVGGSGQQWSKFELGQNRINVGQLIQAADTLQTPVSALLRDADAAAPPALSELDHEGRELLRHYRALPQTERRQLMRAARVLRQSAPAAS